MTKDYYTKLWEKTQGAKGEKHEKKLNVYITRGSPLTGSETVTLVVEVYSQVQKSRIKRADRAVTRNTPMGELRKLAGAMAGALAEQCSDSFGDNLDGKEYEKMGHEAFDALQKGLEQGVLTMATIKG